MHSSITVLKVAAVAHLPVTSTARDVQPSSVHRQSVSSWQFNMLCIPSLGLPLTRCVSHYLSPSATRTYIQLPPLASPSHLRLFHIMICCKPITVVCSSLRLWKGGTAARPCVVILSDLVVVLSDPPCCPTLFLCCPTRAVVLSDPVVLSEPCGVTVRPCGCVVRGFAVRPCGFAVRPCGCALQTLCGCVVRRVPFLDLSPRAMPRCMIGRACLAPVALRAPPSIAWSRPAAIAKDNPAVRRKVKPSLRFGAAARCCPAVVAPASLPCRVAERDAASSALLVLAPRAMPPCAIWRSCLALGLRIATKPPALSC